MTRHYNNSDTKLRKDKTRKGTVRARDGLTSSVMKIKHSKVEDSLDAMFGKEEHFRYRSLGMIRAMKIFLLVLSVCAVVHAENQQLNSAIQGVSSQTVLLQGSASSLSQDETALIQKYHLTNAGQCHLLAVNVSTGPVLMNFVPSTSTITAVQADLTLSSSFTLTAVGLGPAGTQAGKSVQFSKVGNAWRVIVFGLNTTPIGAGTLTSLSFSSLAGTPKGTYPIMIQNLVASDAGGNSNLLCGVSGAIKL